MKPFQIKWGLIAVFLCFVVLSWVLLFRDERALSVIPTLIPSLEGVLDGWRQVLLKNGLNTLPSLFFAGVSIIGFIFYFYSLKANIDIRTSIFYAVIFQAIVFFSYPILSTDIFSYIFSDRVFTVYGENIWKVTPDTFLSDPYAPIADWKDQTKVYGAVNQLVYLPASYLGGENLLLTVALYKLTTLVFSIASLYFFFRLSKEYTNDASKAVRLLFWNPLFVLEVAGSGHNDIIMLFFFLISLYSYWKNSLIWAGVLLALSVQVKLIMGVFLLFAVVELVRKKNLVGLFTLIAAFTAVNVLAFWYMQVSPLDFLSRVLYNTSVYWQSLPALIHKFWEAEKNVFTPLLGFTFLGVLRWMWKKQVDAFLATTVFLLMYLLFFSAAYWNWYVLWVLVAVPFIKVTWLRRVIIIFSFTSLCAYPLLWLSQRFGYNHISWSFIYFIWIFLIPIIFLFLSKKAVPNIFKKYIKGII